MNPKISDFGLARKFVGQDVMAKTKRVVGTLGYIPPEYAVHGRFSIKSDVFSFGVIVLEIVSGKKNRGFSHEAHSDNLLGHLIAIGLELAVVWEAIYQPHVTGIQLLIYTARLQK
uniref:Protein kinase domain-containing protein n=1 Tax=Lactuca sativa TaxID=4236 RepID=A0A9R1WIM2_LACSA|nr:hypothetical protein LSAT_V11C100044480 [Lactuca sativa]